MISTRDLKSKIISKKKNHNFIMLFIFVATSMRAFFCEKKQEKTTEAHNSLESMR